MVIESPMKTHQHIVPAHPRDNDKSPHSHNIKYYILNEKPQGYICDQGCIHEYEPENIGAVQAPEYLPRRNISEPIKQSVSNFEPRKRSPVELPLRPLVQNRSPTSPQNYVTSERVRESGQQQTIKVSRPIRPSLGAASPLPSVNEKSTSPMVTPMRPVSPVASPRFISSGTLASPYRQSSSMPSKTSSRLQSRKSSSTTKQESYRSFMKTKESELENKIPQMIPEKYDKTKDVWSRLYPFKSPCLGDRTSELDKRCPRMDWQSYHRLSVIHDFMDDLEHTLPSLCTVGIIGQSIENRPIKLLKISNGNANNAAVWMDAGIHAREWIGPAVNTYVANYIARNFDKLPPSCTNKDWYFVPVVNPDGYEYSHTNNRMWRKNRAWVDGKCCGVDLNRNFSLGWGGRGSSNDPHHSFYRGTEPFSEPESAALKTVLLDARLPFKVYITLHAFGEVIIFPFACSEDLCPDYIRLLNGAAAMSRAIYQTNGNTYKVGISKDVMYRASGTSNDWCYGEVGIPYCYLIELRSKKHRFKLPQDEIEDTGNEILNCVIALMDFVDKYPLEQSSGDCKRRKAKISCEHMARGP